MVGVSLRHVYKRFGELAVVDDVNLEVADQEFLVLLGPSGCGKTTTMRIIAGLEAASSGDVYIGGLRVNDLLPRHRDVAMVFQSYALYPHMTVFENLEYPLRIRKVPAEQRRKQVIDAARRVNIGELLERLPKQLSGGQRQRVALGRALIRRPNLFLMDEPLSNLDAKLRVQMRGELKHLQHALKTTTIYVTHDQIEAMTLATRVAVMNKGVMQQLATPKEIYDNPVNLFVAGFIGSPSMNFLQGDVAGGVFEGKGARITGLVMHDAGQVTLGVRPEDLTVCGAEDGQIGGEVFSLELTGDSSLLTVQLENTLAMARVDKDFTAEIGAKAWLKANPSRCFLFDARTEARIA
jgi:multiple sugar transport system ATP-binding protein